MADRREGLRSRLIVKVLMTCVIVTPMAGLAFSQTAAALNAPDATSFSVDPIRLSSDSGGHAMFEDVSMAPGDTVTSSVDVASQGHAPTEIRLYGSTSGGRFARTLELEVLRGDRVLYRGSLADFPDRYETGVIDPATWHTSTSPFYRFRISVMRGTRMPKGTTTQSFIWEARSL
jgi:hypothetical protein